MDDLKRIIKLAGRDYVDEADEGNQEPAQSAMNQASAAFKAPAAPAPSGAEGGAPTAMQQANAAFKAPEAPAAAATPAPQANPLGIAPQAQVAGASALTGGAPKPAAPQANALGIAPQAQVAGASALTGGAPAPAATSAVPSPASGLGKGVTAPNNTPSSANMTNAADTVKAAQAGGNKTGTTAPAPAQAAAKPAAPAQAAAKPAATSGVPPATKQAAQNAAGSNIGAGYAKAAAGTPASTPAQASGQKFGDKDKSIMSMLKGAFSPSTPTAGTAAAVRAGQGGAAPAPAQAAAKPASTAAVPAQAAAKPAAPAAPKAPAAPAAPKAPAAPAAPTATAKPAVNPQSNNAKNIERMKQQFSDQAKAAGIPDKAQFTAGQKPGETRSASYSVNTGTAQPAATSGMPAKGYQQQGMVSQDFEESYQGRTGMKRSLVSIMEKFEAELNPAKKGMFKGKSKAELLKQYNALKKSGPHKKGSPENTKMHELAFAIRAKGGWGKVDEELKGGQKKLDKNHNGKLDSDDFKKLRASKVDEADMGKHNNATTGFKALAKKAAKEYGSKAAGERVAGAVKAKMAKAGQLEETATDNPSQTPTKTDIQKRELPKDSSAALGEEMFAKKKDKQEKYVGSFGRDTMTGKDKGLGQHAEKDGPLKNVAKGLKAFLQNKPEPMNENIKVDRMKGQYKNSGNFHKVKDLDKTFESSFTPHDADNPTQKSSKANKAYGNLKVELIKEDPQYSAWENQFQSFLAEEISISTTHNTGHQSDNGMNTPAPEDTVNINARGEDAKELMKLLQNAGMLAGGESHEEPKGHDIELDTPVDGHATVSLGSDDDYEQEHGEEEHGHGDGYGTLQVIHPTASASTDEKPASHGDMMQDLLAKLTGIGAPDMSDDSDDEEDSEEDSDEDDDDEEETSEGNMFTGNLAKARAAGKKTADLDGDGDEEPVKEEAVCPSCHKDPCECDDKAEEAGKKVTKDIEYDEEHKDHDHGSHERHSQDEKAEKAGKKVAKDIEYDEKVSESEDTCNECGMYESHCGCDHEKIEETDNGTVAHGYEQEEEYVSEGVGILGTTPAGIENGADDQATQDLDFMTKVISGGLNKQKINQHVHPYNNPGPGLSESSKDFMKPVSMKDILSRLTEIK